MDHDRMSLAEAVKLVMRRTGKNERQARAAISAMIRQGKLPAFVVDLDTEETIARVPPAWWPMEH